MSPRPRKPKYKGLPDNLYAQKKGAATYFRYRNPQTGRFTAMGTDKRAAVQAAKILNARLTLVDDRQKVEQIVAQVEGGAERFGKFVDRFLEEILPELRMKDGSALADDTIREYRRQYGVIRESLGHLAWKDVNRKRIAEFLDGFPNTASNRYRTRLNSLFKHAIAKGYIDTNPVSGTIEKYEQVKRRRLTMEQYQAIHQQAPAWLQNAMDISLHTLLRREDVVALRWDHIENGRIKVIHKKTKRHEHSKIRITILPPLKAVLDRCRDEVLSPLVIHRIPKKKRKEYVREHWTEVKREMVTREFKKVRDKTGLFDGMPMEERPTFHEVRSLGRKLYEDAGKDVKALGGWSDEKMPEKYLEGHERWVAAEAGLDL